MSIASILSDLWRGGEAFEDPPQTQELQKSPGRLGLINDLLHVQRWFWTSSFKRAQAKVLACFSFSD